MTRRFWIAPGPHACRSSCSAMARHDSRAAPCGMLSAQRACAWIELALATPVVLWGGLAVLRARLGVARQTRSLNMFTLIALGTGAAYAYSVVATLAPWLFPPSFRVHAARSRSTSRRPRSSRRSSCSARCSSCARAAGPAARSARSSASRRRRRGASGDDGSEERRAARGRAGRATGCACGPARRCPSTASCSRARAPSTSRWSPASRSRSRRRRATRVTGGTVNGTGGFVMRAERVGARHAARADRPHGRRGAAQPRADPAPRRRRRGVLRARGRRRRRR